MSRKSNMKMTVLLVLSASLIAAAVTAYLLTLYYRRVCFHILGGFCEGIINQNPDSGKVVLELLKTQNFRMTGENILSNFGYEPSNIGITGAAVLWIAFSGFGAGSILFLFFLVFAQEVLRPYSGAYGLFGKNKYRRSGFGP